MYLQKQLAKAFESCFGEAPALVVRAPGRVNLIGEHTDYNDGFALPMAIDRAVWIALRPRSDGKVLLHSLHFEEAAGFELANLNRQNAGWIEYIKGVAWALQDAGHSLGGWEGIVTGDVPVGAGLSSSAALELAAARAFAAVSNLPWDAAQMALLSQRAENEWVGMNCGIMDQMISAAGQANHALLIDCRSLETTAVPLPPGTAVVVLDTKTRRGLVDSAYNERRAQCEAAAKFFGAPALRDVSRAEFEAKAPQLDALTHRRAKHIITENERVLQSVAAMQNSDAETMGRLMNESHISLRDDFEVSSHELNIMVACARRETSCYGARMTGAGFGGCAVALVEADTAQNFAANTRNSYQAATDLGPSIYVCAASNGAEVVDNLSRSVAQINLLKHN